MVNGVMINIIGYKPNPVKAPDEEGPLLTIETQLFDAKVRAQFQNALQTEKLEVLVLTSSNSYKHLGIVQGFGVWIKPKEDNDPTHVKGFDKGDNVYSTYHKVQKCAELVFGKKGDVNPDTIKYLQDKINMLNSLGVEDPAEVGLAEYKDIQKLHDELTKLLKKQAKQPPSPTPSVPPSPMAPKAHNKLNTPPEMNSAPPLPAKPGSPSPVAPPPAPVKPKTPNAPQQKPVPPKPVQNVPSSPNPTPVKTVAPSAPNPPAKTVVPSTQPTPPKPAAANYQVPVQSQQDLDEMEELSERYRAKDIMKDPVSGVRHHFRLIDAQDKAFIEAKVQSYVAPAGCCAKIKHIFARLWNAIKSIFQVSDWQLAKKEMIKTIEAKMWFKFAGQKAQDIAEQFLKALLQSKL